VGETCDPYSVEAVRASMGSIFAVSIVRATEAAFVAWRGAWPGTVVATLLDATSDFRCGGWREPILILMGAEQAGLSPAMAALADAKVKIPMIGRADSLNLAVAAGIMIYSVVAPPLS
jgi:TrmH family RNA methyltransferase